MTAALQESSETLAQAVLRGQATRHALSRPEGLRAAARKIAEAASAAGCRALVPASTDAQGVVSAAVLLMDDLYQCREGDVHAGHTKVLIIEAVAVSGLKVRAKVESMRQLGADWIGVVVCHFENPGASDHFGGDARWGCPDFLALPGRT